MKAIDAFGRNRVRCGRRKTHEYPKQRVANSLAYLKKKKLIKIIREKNGKIQVKLTNKGEKRLAEYSFDALKIQKPEKWDGQWRVFMFDIPANSKTYQYARNAMRNKIKQLGFYQIQKSVWAYPYECEDELLFVSETLGVQKYIEILTVDRFLHSDIVKKKFSLS
jgi:DNA-binding transcriptional regulator PaaX